LTGMALPWLGFAFGCLTAKLCRRPVEDIIAIAIETGIQGSILQSSISAENVYIKFSSSNNMYKYILVLWAIHNMHYRNILWS
jgi:predicted Na+-dependent transporter